MNTANRYTTRNDCRVCNSTKLTKLFSLGNQYVSNFVEVSQIHNGPKAPIDLELCNNCGLVQLKHTAAQELLYTGNYWYKSGVTQTMKDALKDVVMAAERLVDPGHKDIIVDIGSNDGTLLRSYKNRAYKVGFEPAKNLAVEGQKGVNCLINDFWSAKLYESHEWPKAKVITACGMLYDLETPGDFIRDVAKVLAPNGVFIAQLMCLANMLNVGDVGNFAHEHLEFYSLKSMNYLLNESGLEIFDIERNSVNGESYRLYIRHKGSSINWPVGASRSLHAEEALALFNLREEEMKLSNPNTYRKFFKKMEENKNKCMAFIVGEVKKGKSVWVYGASTKGNVILQYYGLDSLLINGAADRSPSKWGKYTVGTGIRICSEEEARSNNPDYFLVLPYAFLPEFIKREQKWLKSGGKFIVPLPEFRILDHATCN